MPILRAYWPASLQTLSFKFLSILHSTQKANWVKRPKIGGQYRLYRELMFPCWFLPVSFNFSFPRPTEEAAGLFGGRLKMTPKE